MTFITVCATVVMKVLDKAMLIISKCYSCNKLCVYYCGNA